MKTGEQTFLDLGCAFAQDLRRLVADGVDSKQCYASDLRLDFLDLGYELFRDKATLQSKFIAADIFDVDGGPLAELDGKIDIINASSFFHLFPIEEQQQAARHCLKLLKARPGSLIIGRQKASRNPGKDSGRSGGAPKFWHSAESWQKFWQEIGEETGVTFDVVVAMKGTKFEDLKGSLEDTDDVSMSFSVRRL
jgi:SAM-dependent methyltransferase